MTTLSHFEASGHVFQCELAGEAVLLDTQAGVYFGLDEMGTNIWSMVTSGLTALEICDRLEAEYEVDRTRLELDVDLFLRLLAERRLITPSS